MAEVENIINSRPLTYVSIDNENQEALTPVTVGVEYF